MAGALGDVDVAVLLKNAGTHIKPWTRAPRQAFASPSCG